MYLTEQNQIAFCQFECMYDETQPSPGKHNVLITRVMKNC